MDGRQNTPSMNVVHQVNDDWHKCYRRRPTNNNESNTMYWALIITFTITNDAKVAVFKTEQECMEMLHQAEVAFEGKKEVKSMECHKASLSKEESSSNRDDAM